MTMKKHSKEYAEELAGKNYYPKEGRPYHFVKGYMKAIEETNHVELLKEAKRYFAVLTMLQKKYPDIWGEITIGFGIATANGLQNAINKAEQFDEDK